MTQKKDNADKLEGLFHLYEKKMYHIAYSIIHDTWQAEDAVMEAFIKLSKYINQIDDINSEETKRFIIQIIRNSSIDIYRKNKKEMERILTITKEEESRISIEKENNFNYSENVEDIINGLPPKYKCVMYEKYAKGNSVREIANKLKISETAVRKRQERAIKMLRERIGEVEYERIY